jgi:DNA polymerase-4
MSAAMDRNIVHIEVAEFPISLERLLNPRLRARPVAIAPATTGRAQIYVTSKEARKAGIRRGMRVDQARRLCRDLVIVPPNPRLYLDATQEMVHTLGRFSPLVEPERYGHAYLDVSGMARLFGGLKDMAYRAQKEVGQRLQMMPSVGLGGNKLVSRIAAQLVEPDGFSWVVAGEERTFLAPLAVGYLPVVRRLERERLWELNLARIVQVQVIPPELLVLPFGRHGLLLHQQAQGIDPRPVRPPERQPEVFEFEALAEDSNDPALLGAVLQRLVERSCATMRKRRAAARKVQLTIVYSDYRETKGQKTFRGGVNQVHEVLPALKELFHKLLSRRTRVRRIELVWQRLVPSSRQLSLFDSPAKPRPQRVERAIEKIRERFGELAVGFGVTGISGRSPFDSGVRTPSSEII